MIFGYLYAIINSGFWEIDNLKDWAFELIEKNEKCPWWLAEFTLANNKSDLLNVICNAYNNQLNLNTHCAILGYYFLLYKSGQITSKECIKLCSDTYDSFFDEDTNPFYSLFNYDEIVIDLELKKLCAEYKAEAERQYNYIRDFNLET